MSPNRNSGDATDVHCMIVQYSVGLKLNSCMKFYLMFPPKQNPGDAPGLKPSKIFENLYTEKQIKQF